MEKKKNTNKISWYLLCLNPNAIPLLEANTDKIIWHWLFENPNAIELLKNDGVFLFTCASIGRPEHGTKRTSPSDSPFTSKLENDYYRNLSEEDIRSSINVDEIFSEYEFQSRSHYPQDLYFFGIKK